MKKTYTIIISTTKELADKLSIELEDIEAFENSLELGFTYHGTMSPTDFYKSVNAFMNELSIKLSELYNKKVEIEPLENDDLELYDMLYVDIELPNNDN